MRGYSYGILAPAACRRHDVAPDFAGSRTACEAYASTLLDACRKATPTRRRQTVQKTRARPSSANDRRDAAHAGLMVSAAAAIEQGLIRPRQQFHAGQHHPLVAAEAASTSHLRAMPQRAPGLDMAFQQE